MKTKGISFWEQNIERLVLGLAVVVCLALIAMQFLGEPNAVDVAGKTISPGDVDQQLKDKATSVDGILDGTEEYKFGATAEPVLARLNDRITTPLAPQPTLRVWAPPVSLGGGPTGDPNRPFHSPKIPAASDLLVQQYFDTIPADVGDGTEGLKALIGATAAPYDVTWATPSAKFAIADIVKLFNSDGPKGEAAMLDAWHNDRADFIDLKVERQEYVDGEWKNDTLISPLPGYFSFRTELKDKKIDDALRNMVLASAVDPATRAQIIQPPFYATLTESWVAPGGEAAAALNILPNDPAAAEKQERAELKKRLDAVIKSLKERGCPDAAPPKPEPTKPDAKPPKTSGGGGGGGSAPGLGGGGGDEGKAGGEMRSSGGSGAADLAACKGMWARRKTLETQIAKLDAEIAKIENKEPAKPVEVAEEVEEVEEILDVWAHDLTIVPGKTYRYRFTVEVYNPLFGRKLELIPEQQPLAEQFTLSSEPSAWSEPLTAQPPLRLFVTQAFSTNTSSVGIPVGQATAEVYRFHNGRWWVEPFRLSPGTRVGDTKESSGGAAVDFATEWFVLDVVTTLGADSQQEKDGYGAMVMLQSLGDPSKIIWREPRIDMTDPERRRLMGRVKLADLSGDAVAANTGPEGGRTGSDAGTTSN